MLTLCRDIRGDSGLNSSVEDGQWGEGKTPPLRDCEGDVQTQGKKKKQNKPDFIPVRKTKIKASEIPEGTEGYWERSGGIERHTMTRRDKQNTLQLPWHWSLVEEGTPKA